MGPLTELREAYTYKIASVKQHVSFISNHFKHDFNNEICEFMYSYFYLQTNFDKPSHYVNIQSFCCARPSTNHLLSYLFRVMSHICTNMLHKTKCTAGLSIMYRPNSRPFVPNLTLHKA